MEKNKSIKPLGKKAYGSIPHLLGSKLGQGDYHIHEGQNRICTEKARDKHDVIIVQEKLDGSCVSVAKVNGQIFALTRAGYLATDSPYSQHWYFNNYVRKNIALFDNLLSEGDRLCGEWLAMAHGTRYDLNHDPFVGFDIMTGTVRKPYEIVSTALNYFGIPFSKAIYIGKPISPNYIEWNTGYGAEQMEGLIYRVERKGEVDFLGKFVRHDYVAGKYFEDKTGCTIWNNWPGKELELK